mgnify:CR=1 FL=1
MLFQLLDEKDSCYAAYVDGNFFYDDIPIGLTKTWKYSNSLKDKNIEYAKLYCGGLSLGEVCPAHLKEQFDSVNDKLKAFMVSFSQAKISLSDNCFYNLVPERYLLELSYVKDKICEHVFENYDKPKNYDFLLELEKIIDKLKAQELKIDKTQLKNRLSEYKVRQFYNKLNNISPFVSYNMFGTKTGRLSTSKGSFPILTMDKTYRKVLAPKNEWFVELDYNAAELRTMLALLGKKQPDGDIHDWNVKNIYNDLLTREEAKKKIFAWLYNPNSKDGVLNRTYDRDEIVEKYWNGSRVKTCFHREIESDKFHALNYIIQSTFSDIVLRQVIALDKILEGRKTKIAFVIHDSVVLDMSAEDEHLMNEIFHGFENTMFGKFKANVSAGKNFGSMKKLWIH